MNERLARLEQWRGLPIPFFASRRDDGTPDFKVVDELHRLRCAAERLCWICGEVLTYYMVFVGGPTSAGSRLYFDGPMHEECAQDSLKLCPFLIGRVDYSKNKRPDTRVTHTVQGADPIAPDELVVYKTRNFTMRREQGELLFHPAPAVSKETISRFGERHAKA